MKITAMVSMRTRMDRIPKASEKMKLELVRLNPYPDSSFKKLCRTLGRVHGVSPECISISRGAEGMLQTIGRCFIQEGDEVILPAAPTA
jgi:histidinol-phosphate aminotransferase